MTQQEFVNTMLQLASQASKDLQSGKSESDVKAQMQKVAEESGALYYRPENSSNLPFELAHNHPDVSQGSWGKSDNDILNRLLYEYTSASDEDTKRAYQQDLMNYIMALNERDYNKDLTADERAYNLAMLQEQRQYDLPQQQLQRLMATGLSRQAALSMLNGGSGGSGSGSSPLVGSSKPIPSPDLGAHEYTQPAGSSLRNKTGAFVDITTGLANLASTALTGVSLSNSLKTGALLDNEIFSSNMQRDAVESVGEFMGALYANRPDGSPYLRPAEGVVRNAESLLTWAQNVSREENLPLYDYVRSPNFRKFANNPFAWNLYDTTYGTHSNAAQQKTEDDYLVQSELLLGQKHLQDIQLQAEGSNLRLLLDQNDATRKLIPYLSDLNIEKAKDDIELLKAARTKEQMAARLEYIQNHNYTLAYMSACEMLQAKEFAGMLQGQPNIYRSALGMGAFLNLMGFDGIIGNVVRVNGMAAAGFSATNSQIEQSTPLGSIRQVPTKFGSWIQQSASSFFNSFKNFWKENIGDNVRVEHGAIIIGHKSEGPSPIEHF